MHKNHSTILWGKFTKLGANTKIKTMFLLQGKAEVIAKLLAQIAQMPAGQIWSGKDAHWAFFAVDKYLSLRNTNFVALRSENKSCRGFYPVERMCAQNILQHCWCKGTQKFTMNTNNAHTHTHTHTWKKDGGKIRSLNLRFPRVLHKKRCCDWLGSGSGRGCRWSRWACPEKTYHRGRCCPFRSPSVFPGRCNPDLVAPSLAFYSSTGR